MVSLKEEDVIPRIRAMEGRRGRPPNPDRQRAREESRMRRRKGRALQMLAALWNF